MGKRKVVRHADQDRLQRADATVADQFARVAAPTVRAALAAALKDAIVALDRLDHGPALPDSQRHGLLAIDVLSGLGGGNGFVDALGNGLPQFGHDPLELTCRHAFRLLQEQGFVERYQGRGTIVRATQPRKLPILVNDYSESIREAAPSMARTLVYRDNIVPPRDVSEILGRSAVASVESEDGAALASTDGPNISTRSAGGRPWPTATSTLTACYTSRTSSPTGCPGTTST